MGHDKGHEKPQLERRAGGRDRRDGMGTTKQKITIEDAIARLTEAARQEPSPVHVTLGPIELPPPATLWIIAPDTRVDVKTAAAMLNLTVGAIYAAVARGDLPKTKLHGKLTFTAATLRQFLVDHER